LSGVFGSKRLVTLIGKFDGEFASSAQTYAGTSTLRLFVVRRPPRSDALQLKHLAVIAHHCHQ